jgi:hypothetical protein
MDKLEVNFHSTPICSEETEFVKNIRNTHCKGCMNEYFPGCGACDVLNCWLHKTYLPEGEWRKAVECDTIAQQAKDIGKAIDKEILKGLEKELKKVYGKEKTKKRLAKRIKSRRLNSI